MKVEELYPQKPILTLQMIHDLKVKIEKLNQLKNRQAQLQQKKRLLPAMYGSDMEESDDIDRREKELLKKEVRVMIDAGELSHDDHERIESAAMRMVKKAVK